ncbi:copper resistance protein NlpE N-terminal domain-containing protein [Biostraticola tofi]|uniref:Copper homeostasis protein (Lipoprotein) n=1 Tax=Biostraticola tofi TaxID=466109 RepID=A0A4R3YIR5_9GAMM|nr:copper resistance protein NlpE N-terminal domain-containing protein [Biostraticola tofi]TCV92565.1 copper homeostasis protein (lipoprotein) [Biostraticola tofi]
MKNIIVFVVIIFSAILIGCHTPVTKSDRLAQSLKPMHQSYNGVYYCPSCGNSNASLYLASDGSFMLNQHQVNSASGDQHESRLSGSWARTADKLTLTEEGTGRKLIFRTLNNGLQMVDKGGAPIVSGYRYQLSPVYNAT